MAFGRKGVLGKEDDAAGRTFFAICQPGLGTASVFAGNDFFGMAGGRKGLKIPSCSAVNANFGGFACLGATWLGNNRFICTGLPHDDNLPQPVAPFSRSAPSAELL